LVGWSGVLPHAGFEELARAVEGFVATPAAQPAKASEVAAPAAVIYPAAAAPFTAGETRENPKDGLTYVWVPPGKFTMGCSTADAECDDDENPPREVTLTRGFWLGQTPVTEAADARFLEANGEKTISRERMEPPRASRRTGPAQWRHETNRPGFITYNFGRGAPR
jgi:formylglycine-generating enzyme required for sulfatase activity